MQSDDQAHADPTLESSVRNVSGDEGLTLDRLSEAFAEMLQAGSDPYESAQQRTTHAEESIAPLVAEDDGANNAAISPKSILESMLFVGNSDNRPLSASHVASMMRGVRPAEIEQWIDELNEQYTFDGAPYEIVSEGAGYRMVLRSEFAAVRDRFYGQPREATLSQAAIEVLSLVAYQQPITVDELNKRRNTSSGSVLSQLVRRDLLRFECDEASPKIKRYYTTDRFLQLFGLSSLTDLPQSHELEVDAE
ncbi:MAG: SMC-Scp complex subunit ScpB [Planctomycetales bacterium]|nr:SMC-Scp complex subunit ScpB [Planctomycetales bacterium]